MHGRSNTVLPKREPLTEEEFRSTWLLTLARLCREHGDGKVALWLGVSERHLRSLKAGQSIPSPHRIWNLLLLDPTAHDEIDGEYGAKNVTAGSVCTNDPLAIDMIGLAHETAIDESPESHGGASHTDHELSKKNEARLRRIHRRIGNWLNRLDTMRKPNLKAVGE